jgi:hypothetical protein
MFSPLSGYGRMMRQNAQKRYFDCLGAIQFHNAASSAP